MSEMNDTYLYPYSVKDAKSRGELKLWRASYVENIGCKAAIEQAILRDFDGMSLKPDCAKRVIEEYGFKRVNFVLANTLRELSHDGRFSRAHQEWGRRIYVPPDKQHNSDFTVTSHPAVLDGFINEARKAYQELGLFGPEHCAGSREVNYEGKVLILSPDTLKESCWSPQNQLWYAHDGFGGSPTAIGRSIRSTCLGDGEMTRWDRSDFIGALDEQYLPDWAKPRLAELVGQTQAGPTINGMTM